jgi:NAD-dependent dihydropyrimidine dehydrogenase PreA subunit
VTSESDVYTKLAGRAGLPQSRVIREVYQLQVTADEAEMLLELPASVAEFAQKLRVDEATAQRRLEEFARKGVAILRERQDVLVYFNPSSPIMFHDTTSYATFYRKYEPLHDEILKLWRDFRETEWIEIMRQVPKSGSGGVRVIPVRGAIEDTSDMLPYEDIGSILEEAPGIAVNDCACRMQRVREEKCDKPTWTCLYFTPFSVKHLSENGIGRELTVDEAYEICETAAEAGLVPTVSGGGPRVSNICWCCTDCCIVLHPLAEYDYGSLGKSRYKCLVDDNLCDGCQVCIDRCQFDAIDMTKVAGSNILKAVVNPDKCYGCGVCVIKCPTKAMRLTLVRPVEHIPTRAGATALDVREP